MPRPSHSVPPFVRVLYLVAVAVGMFLASQPRPAAALAGAQIALWFAVGLPAGQLLRQVRKFWGFALLIVGSYALTTVDPDTDQWTRVAIGDFGLSVNSGGAAAGLVMVIRIVAVVIASQVARAGDPRAIAQGLRTLRAPHMFAVSMDAVLALLGDTGGRGGGGRGSGGGGGGGRGRRKADAGTDPDTGETFWTSLKRLGSGDVGAIVERLDRQIDRARAHAASQPPDENRHASSPDIAVITGVALTMLGIKALKVLPSLPFAPGHKMVILLPLYVIAARQTRTRFGATYAGLTMGTIAFLMGDGRYGIFEICKHVAPGLLCDLLIPFMTAGHRQPGRLAWSIFGAVVGLGRFATTFVIVLAAQAPAVAYAIFIPGLTTNLTFGFLSGYVTFQVVRSVEHARTHGGEHEEKAWVNS